MGVCCEAIFQVYIPRTGFKKGIRKDIDSSVTTISGEHNACFQMFIKVGL
jgi:hypothetical protein